jgi:hypothetical protein
MAAVCEVAFCGVLAVGRCATCGRAMCTSHRAASRGTPVMDRCVECEQARADDRALRSDRARSAHARHVSALAAMAPGFDRLVRTLHYLAGVSFGRTSRTGPLRFEPILPDFNPDLAFACPDYWPGGAVSVDLLQPPWDPLAVAAWFLDRVAATGKPPNALLEGWVTATGNWWHGHHSMKAHPLPAWRFQEGSLTHMAEDDPRATDDRRCDAYVVAADGRVMRAFDKPCRLGARALVSMGVLLWGQPAKPWDSG